jgi:hypothetical protein
VLESALFEEVEGAADEPATGTSVPSACKINLAGPVASVDGEDTEVAGWAQLGVCINTKSAQKLASQLHAPNAALARTDLESPWRRDPGTRRSNHWPAGLPLNLQF